MTPRATPSAPALPRSKATRRPATASAKRREPSAFRVGIDRPLVVSIIGTRPEAIKMTPVARALAASSRFGQRVVLTGQHAELNCEWATDDLRVDPSYLSAGELSGAIRDRLRPLLARLRPSLVLVQGDTASALAGALAACDCAIPIGHVEAGLRSFDLQHPWPEEGNRIAIDELSTLLFAPTEQSAHNLTAEPSVDGAIFITGNSGIDALFQARGARPAPPIASDRKLILVTCHRRENRGAELDRLAAALRRIVDRLPLQIVLPLHTNPHVRAGIEQRLSGCAHIHLEEPAGHAEMVGLIDASWLILTDSGGLQEEGPALGKPVLVLRSVTERAEAPDNIELVGTDPDRIFEAVERLWTDAERYRRMATPSLAFGDGHAGERIAAIVKHFLSDPKGPFPNAWRQKRG
ncbi:MAG TPA: UDP-N-acetylglucosamine 2-epimerase (non-hydrolyzing) [Allosphingosinicella sp.]